MHGQPAAKVIKCECGFIARGQTEKELLDTAEQHIRNDHPDLVGRVSRTDLLEMAEDA